MTSRDLGWFRDRARPIHEQRRDDLRVAARLRKVPRMPKTPQGDLSAEKLDTKSLGKSLDQLHAAAAEALDAAAEAGQRERAVQAATDARLARRFGGPR